MSGRLSERSGEVEVVDRLASMLVRLIVDDGWECTMMVCDHARVIRRMQCDKRVQIYQSDLAFLCTYHCTARTATCHLYICRHGRVIQSGGGHRRNHHDYDCMHCTGESSCYIDNGHKYAYWSINQPALLLIYTQLYSNISHLIIS